MKCKDCPFWQGTKHNEWGDCHRVISQLEPKLMDCYIPTEDGFIAKFFSVPFDPHDSKYWYFSEEWTKVYHELIDHITHGDFEGVRAECGRRDDVIYDFNGGERIGKLNCWYVQTNRNYECQEEDE